MIRSFSALIFLILICSSAFSQSGWVWQNPQPQGNTIANMKFINQNTGYCVCPAGVIIKTTNSGYNWSVMKTQLPSDLNGISIISQNIVYAAGGNEVYKTADAGLSWNMKHVGTSVNISSVCFINESTGFLGGDQVVLKTTNGGDNWASSNSYPYGSVNVMYFIDANTGFAAGGSFYIRRTTNSGGSWVTVYQESGIGAYLSMVFVNSSTGFIVGSGGRVRKSTNSGTSWFSLNAGTSDELYSISSFDSLNLAAAGANGTVVKTTNGGTSWVLGTVDIPTLYGISFLSKNILVTGGSLGMIAKSTDSGDNWSLLSSGMYFSMYNSFFINSKTGFITSGEGILKTSDWGNSWVSKTAGDFRSVSFADDLTGYASGSGGAIYKTTNAGESWTAQNSGVTSALFAIHFVNQQTGFAAGPPTTLLRTSNGGINWEKNTITSNGQVNDICFINSNTGFMVTGAGKIVKTTDSGYNWTVVFTSSFGIIYEIDFGDQNHGYAVGGNKLISTTNGGNSWVQSIPSTSPLSLEDIACVDFINGNTGYIGGLIMLSGSSEVAICKTTNGGANWSMDFPGLKLNIYSLSTVSADTCFITSSSGGILRNAAGLTSITPVSNIAPSEFALIQNYPNPFNPATKIKYLIPNAGEVRLSIYDILGREIAVLVNEKQNPGAYEIGWNAAGYPSGVYFYKITTSEFTETKRMMLVK